MGTPARTGIILAVKSALEGVTVANGYHTTVALVEPYLRGRDDVPVGQRPYIGFGIGQETATNEPTSQIYVTTSLVVVGLVAQAAWTDRSAAINNLTDDIISAVLRDQTQNNNAVTTKLLTIESDEADADAMADGGAVVVEFEVVYYRTTGST